MKGLILGLAVASLLGISWKAHAVKPTQSLGHVKSQLEQFKPVKIGYDTNILSASDKKALEKLVEAARLMDHIFLRQVWSGNVKLQEELEGLKGNERVLRDYFTLSVGPFDRLDHDKPFIDAGLKEKPAGANFYPEDMTKQEFEDWIKRHPNDKKAFESNFTVIRREGKELKAIPYSEVYREWLLPAAKLLKEAADIAENPGLKKYLRSRADAFLSNDYFESDCDWMDLKDHTIEVVFGPYEVYEDNLMGYKAAFEAFVTVVDPQESARLAKVVSHLDEMEMNLPIPKEYHNVRRGKESPIVVTNEVYTGGDAKKTIQTIAFNLPNDERVREAKGSKKVMLKNVSKAKFDAILMPIAKAMMDTKDVRDVSFDAFFNHTLLHEISHGLGPGTISVNGKSTTVNKALKDLYSVIEECKADTLGVLNTLFLNGKEMYTKEFIQSLFPTYLAGIFRSTRFGIKEAHGGSNIMQFNYLREKGAFTYDEKNKKFTVDRAKIEEAIKSLAHDLLMLEAKGDYEGAQKFVEKYRMMPKEIEGALSMLKNVPVDIMPIYAFK
jgi:hypothetical protein